MGSGLLVFRNPHAEPGHAETTKRQGRLLVTAFGAMIQQDLRRVVWGVYAIPDPMQPSLGQCYRLNGRFCLTR